MKESDTVDAEERDDEDDLASFGILSSPDLEANGLAHQSDAEEADLAALAAVSPAVRDPLSHRFEQEGDTTIDLSKADGLLVSNQIDLDGPAVAVAPGSPLDSPAAWPPMAANRHPPQPSPPGLSGFPAPAPWPAGYPAPLTAEAALSAPQRRWILPLLLAGFALGLGSGALVFFLSGSGRGGSSEAATGSGARAASAPPAGPAAGAGRVDPADAPPKPAVTPSTSQALAPAATRSTSQASAALAPADAPADSAEPGSARPSAESGSTETRLARSAPSASQGRKRSEHPAAQAAAPERPAASTPARVAVRPEDGDSPGTGVIDAVLGEALGGGQRSEARAREASARTGAASPNQVDLFNENAVPQIPSRQQVTEAMKVMLPAIRGCAMGRSGLATANIVVRNDGRVASAVVQDPPFAGTASGRCIEGAIRKARFPAFRQSSFRVSYPLYIRSVARDDER